MYLFKKRKTERDGEREYGRSFTSNISAIIAKSKGACNRNDDLSLLWFSAFKNIVGFVRDGLFLQSCIM